MKDKESIDNQIVKKRVMVFGASSSLPRSKPQVTFYEDTYLYLLTQYYQVFQCCIGGALIEVLAEQSHYYAQYNPDIVILHNGISDCAPRAYTNKEEMFFKYTWIGHQIRGFFSKTIGTRKIRRIRKKVWTDKKTFAEQIKKIHTTFGDKHCFAISIVPITDEYEKFVPGVRKNRDEYNALLKAEFGDGYIDLSDMPTDYIMTDFFHLTDKGHKYVFDRIMDKLKEQHLL